MFFPLAKMNPTGGNWFPLETMYVHLASYIGLSRHMA